MLKKEPTRQSDSQAKIEIISCNIEDIKSNITYLHSLQLSKTVLCLQEHHLWDFQKHELTKLIPSMGNVILCHDTNDPRRQQATANGTCAW